MLHWPSFTSKTWNLYSMTWNRMQLSYKASKMVVSNTTARAAKAYDLAFLWRMDFHDTKIRLYPALGTLFSCQWSFVIWTPEMELHRILNSRNPSHFFWHDLRKYLWLWYYEILVTRSSRHTGAIATTRWCVLFPILLRKIPWHVLCLKHVFTTCGPMGHDHNLGKAKNRSASWVPQDTGPFEYPKRYGIQDLWPEACPESFWNVDIDFWWEETEATKRTR